MLDNGFLSHNNSSRVQPLFIQLELPFESKSGRRFRRRDPIRSCRNDTSDKLNMDNELDVSNELSDDEFNIDEFDFGSTIKLDTEVLGHKHGGRASINTYCRYYASRPPALVGVICQGWNPCPDRDRCKKNKHVPYLSVTDRKELEQLAIERRRNHMKKTREKIKFKRKSSQKKGK